MTFAPFVARSLKLLFDVLSLHLVLLHHVIRIQQILDIGWIDPDVQIFLHALQRRFQGAEVNINLAFFAAQLVELILLQARPADDLPTRTVHLCAKAVQLDTHFARLRSVLRAEQVQRNALLLTKQ